MGGFFSFLSSISEFLESILLLINLNDSLYSNGWIFMKLMEPELSREIQRYNEAMRQMNSAQRFIPPNINKFSPAYSRIIASKPRAGKSANIRLGGVY